MAEHGAEQLHEKRRKRILKKLHRLDICSILYNYTGAIAVYADEEFHLSGEEKKVAHAEAYLSMASRIIEENENRAVKEVLEHPQRYIKQDMPVCTKGAIQADLKEIALVLGITKKERKPRTEKQNNAVNIAFYDFKNKTLEPKKTVVEWRDLCMKLYEEISTKEMLSNEEKRKALSLLKEKSTLAGEVIKKANEKARQAKGSFSEEEKADILRRKRTLRVRNIRLTDTEDENLTGRLFKAVADVTLTPEQLQEIDNKCHASFEKESVPEEKLLDRPELEYVEGIAVGNGMQMFRVYYNTEEHCVALDYTLRCVDFIPELRKFLTPEMVERINKPSKSQKERASIVNLFQDTLEQMVYSADSYQSAKFSQGITLRYLLDEKNDFEEMQIIPTAGKAIAQMTYESVSAEFGKAQQGLDFHILKQFIQKNTRDEGLKAGGKLNGGVAFDILAAVSAEEIKKKVFSENIPAIMRVTEPDQPGKTGDRYFMPAALIQNHADVVCKFPIPGRGGVANMANGGLLLYQTGLNREQMKAMAYLCDEFRKIEDIPRDPRFQF